MVSRVPTVPFGIAFGILRGACQVPGCTCDSYKAAANSGCTCGHFPASHRNLGPAESLNVLKPQSPSSTEEDVSLEPLKRKDIHQVGEWPQVLNMKVTPYQGIRFPFSLLNIF